MYLRHGDIKWVLNSFSQDILSCQILKKKKEEKLFKCNEMSGLWATHTDEGLRIFLKHSFRCEMLLIAFCMKTS